MDQASRIEPGWWDAHVPRGLNPVETVELLRRIRPSHPALPDLEGLAEVYERAKAAGRIDPGEVRCPICRDSGVDEFASGEVRLAGRRSPRFEGVLVDATEVRVGRPCQGVGGNGCAHLAWKYAKREEQQPAKARKDF